MKINLDINRSEPILETINLRQGDGGLRTIDIQITENNQPIAITGYTLQFEANLPNGLMTQHAGVIKDATAGLFSYTFTSSDTSEVGQLPVAYFRLYDSAKNSVATRNIRIVVDRAADITKAQAGDYLSGIDTLTADAKAKLESNNQQIAAQQAQLDSIKANGLIIGGRNLVTGSSNELKTVTASGWGTSPSSPASGTYGAGRYYASAYVENTTPVAIAISVRINGLGYNIMVDRIPAGKSGIVSGMFDILEGQSLNSVFISFTSEQTERNTYKYKEMMVKSDQIAWTPAPEDYLARIAALEQAILNK